MIKEELKELNKKYLELYEKEIETKDEVIIKTINRKTQQKGVASIGIGKNKNFIFIFEGAGDGSDDKKQTIDEFLENYIFFIDYEI